MSPFIITIFSLILISGFCGWFFSRNKPVEKPVKAMLFVLYFWVGFFIQLMLIAALYYFGLFKEYF